jgi:GNAT superfamily N-acetyltransferase
MASSLRQATRADIPGIWAVRYSVAENTLTPGRISDEDVRREIEDSGRGWVIEEDDAIVAFGIANARTGNIWALFVRPEAQGRGFGDAMHAAMLAWLATQPVRELWLTTGADTRAASFYERRGWVAIEQLPDGEIKFVRPNAA